jgi:hypothetical protein
MKRLFIIILIFFVFTNCKKDINNSIDIRDYYSGKFEFSISLHEVEGEIRSTNNELWGNYGNYTNTYDNKSNYIGTINKFGNIGFDIVYGSVMRPADVNGKKIYLGSGRINPVFDTLQNFVVLFDTIQNKISFSESFTRGDTSFKCSGIFYSEDSISFQTNYSSFVIDTTFKDYHLSTIVHVINVIKTIDRVTEYVKGHRVK